MTKRKKFGEFFIRKLIPIGIAGIILGSVTSVLSYIIVKQEHFSNIQQTALVTVSTVDQFPADSPELKLKLSIIAQINNNPGFSFNPSSSNPFGEKYSAAILITDEETDEVVCDSSFRLFAHRRENEYDDMTVYYCDDEAVLNKLDEYIRYHNFTVSASEIYVSGDKFIPGDTIITYSEGYTEEYESIDEKVVNIDFTPEDTGNYTKIIDYQFMVGAGNFKDSEVLGELHRAAKTDNVREEIYNGKLEGERFLFKDSYYIGEKSYEILSLYVVDIQRECALIYIIIWSGIVFFVILISVVSSLIAYNRYKNSVEMEEYRRNMTNALAHDLKSPLTTIYGYAENLRNNVHSEKREHYADSVLENVRYMNGLIDATLEFSRYENSEIKLNPESLDIIAIISELFGKYDITLEEKSISLSVCGNLIASADRTLVSRALENLVSNAVKYTPENGKIEVLSDGKKLIVKNTCKSGLKAGNELLEPLAKGEESRTGRNGNGLGLSLAKSALSLNNAKLSVEAENGIFTATADFIK